MFSLMHVCDCYYKANFFLLRMWFPSYSYIFSIHYYRETIELRCLPHMLTTFIKKSNTTHYNEV